MSDTDPQINRAKIRAGLAIISVVFVGAIVAAILVDDPLGRWAMGGVALFALVRLALLVRGMRAEAAAPQ